ncbi:MAG: hypothetical protein HRT90_00790 [Candidatus Margulisbacteria bacterium]|nr:hypothetical protein [Candidatus Margulisiibacteriota bacterium]
MKKIVAMDVWTKDVTLSTLQKEGKNLWSYCHFYYAERKKLADYPIWKMLMQNVTVKSYFMNILGTKEVGIEFHPTEDKNRVLFYFNFSVKKIMKESGVFYVSVYDDDNDDDKNKFSFFFDKDMKWEEDEMCPEIGHTENTYSYALPTTIHSRIRCSNSIRLAIKEMDEQINFLNDMTPGVFESVKIDDEKACFSLMKNNHIDLITKMNEEGLLKEGIFEKIEQA